MIPHTLRWWCNCVERHSEACCTCCAHLYEMSDFSVVGWTQLLKTWDVKSKQNDNFDLCYKSKAFAFEVGSVGFICVRFFVLFIESALITDYWEHFKLRLRVDVLVLFERSMFVCLLSEKTTPTHTSLCISSLVLFCWASPLYLTLTGFLMMKRTLLCHWFVLFGLIPHQLSSLTASSLFSSDCYSHLSYSTSTSLNMFVLVRTVPQRQEKLLHTFSDSTWINNQKHIPPNTWHLVKTHTNSTRTNIP